MHIWGCGEPLAHKIAWVVLGFPALLFMVLLGEGLSRKWNRSRHWQRWILFRDAAALAAGAQIAIVLGSGIVAFFQASYVVDPTPMYEKAEVIDIIMAAAVLLIYPFMRHRRARREPSPVSSPEEHIPGVAMLAIVGALIWSTVMPRVVVGFVVPYLFWTDECLIEANLTTRDPDIPDTEPDHIEFVADLAIGALQERAENIERILIVLRRTREQGFWTKDARLTARNVGALFGIVIPTDAGVTEAAAWVHDGRISPSVRRRVDALLQSELWLKSRQR